NALASGWSASSQGYDSWPSADLYCPNGISGANDPGVEGQGALQCVSGSFAELKLHTYELQGWQPNTRQGWLVRAIPYTDPELLHPEDLIWPVGVNNFRVQYTAGYTTIPDRKSTRLNSSHVSISYAVFCLKKKKATLLRAITPTCCPSRAVARRVPFVA